MVEYYLIVFLPLVGFLTVGLLGSFLSVRGSELITTFCCFVSALFSWIAFFSLKNTETSVLKIPLMRFMDVGILKADWAFRIDTLTAVMLIVVTTVSACVHIYSIGYMHHDPHRPRFFAYLCLFTFSMLFLIASDNLVQMFVGWEAVGLSSFLLIGFWYQKPSANAAAMKAFLVNRVGDFGFILGILGLYILFDSVNFDTIFAEAERWSRSLGNPSNSSYPMGIIENSKSIFLGWDIEKTTLLNMTCLFLFMGAAGKSAQIPLHVWLADAMEGPTPVSALIHAATMVTAGVFMLARLSPLFELSGIILTFVIVIGTLTAVLSASVALVQNDIKRVIAWSTCSQLGYMFVAVGCGAYAVALFHLFTHAFFKALLFLGAGSVIHAVSGEQDMRQMGDLKKHIPITYAIMIIGTLAITGVGIPGSYFGFSGFFSKDAIIESIFLKSGFIGHASFWILLITACLTSFYSWRLIFMVFHRKSRVKQELISKIHEAPLVMIFPLAALALGALFSGFIFYKDFIGEHSESFWKGALFTAEGNTILHSLHNVPSFVKGLPFIAMSFGLIVSWFFYIYWPSAPNFIARNCSAVHRCFLNAFYFDRAYAFLFVKPIKSLGLFLSEKGDKVIIDGFGPNAACARVLDCTRYVVRLQSGYIHHYAFAMFIGLTALITWIMFQSFVL